MPGYRACRRTRQRAFATSWRRSARPKLPASEPLPSALPTTQQRLSPLSPVVRIGRSFIGLIVILGADRFSGGGSGGQNRLIDIAIVAAAVVLGTISWYVTTWRIDGPRFYVAAADGPDVTSSVGALGPDGAFFWGEGGDVVKITTDGGLRWSATGFGDGVYSVRAAHGTLRTVALGNQVKGGAGGAFGAFLYISTDAGRTWKLHGVLPDVRE